MQLECSIALPHHRPGKPGELSDLQDARCNQMITENDKTIDYILPYHCKPPAKLLRYQLPFTIERGFAPAWLFASVSAGAGTTDALVQFRFLRIIFLAPHFPASRRWGNISCAFRCFTPRKLASHSKPSYLANQPLGSSQPLYRYIFQYGLLNQPSS